MRRAVVAGIDARLGGAAGGHNEHWLQAVLGRQPRSLGLEQPILREVPAWRPNSDPDGTGWRSGWSRGFVDFIGVDSRGDLHIVETKVGADPMLVLQGIDYLAWANVPGHRQRLAARLDIQPDVPISLHFVIGTPAGGKVAISPTSHNRSAQYGTPSTGDSAL